MEVSTSTYTVYSLSFLGLHVFLGVISFYCINIELLSDVFVADLSCNYTVDDIVNNCSLAIVDGDDVPPTFQVVGMEIQTARSIDYETNKSYSLTVSGYLPVEPFFDTTATVNITVDTSMHTNTCGVLLYNYGF